tara:strand:+ start:130 stop:1329 length:1200 start_codon:yes stop_codon:yes gene_type:complete
MRIVFLTSEFVSEPNSFDGGLSNYLFKIAFELKKNGHEPIIIVSSFENKYLKYEGISVHRVKPERNLTYKAADKLSRFKFQLTLDLLLQSYAVNKKIRELNQKIKIDLIQFPSHHAIGLFVPKKIKSVMRISGYQKLADPANGLHYETIRDRQLQILEYLTYKKAKNIFGPSYFLCEIISKEFKKPVQVIESPCDTRKIEYDNTILDEIKKESKHAKFGLFFGKLAQIKGLVEISNILNTFFLNHTNLYFVIIGKDVGHNGLSSLDFIYNKIKTHRNRLIYFKEQNHEKLLPVIKKADFILMPSRIENFPNACVEAMSLSKIVIASKGISFEQLINDKENGFLFENANSKDLLNVIEQVLNLPPERKKDIEKNAKKTVERLHPDITVKKLIKYYQSIIK